MIKINLMHFILSLPGIDDIILDGWVYDIQKILESIILADEALEVFEIEDTINELVQAANELDRSGHSPLARTLDEAIIELDESNPWK